ncbi:hypothetical protein WAZ07_18320 [Bacillus sp. FJAT-51639]|uniref:Uncharacterized protein n=1 Tax=Bacillus bruguierae TaxID=3127667 RepID=A0ABU8FMU3_9BACI
MCGFKKIIVSTMLTASLFTLSACKEKEVVRPVEKKEEQIGIQTTVEELRQHIDKRGYILYTDYPIRRVTSENNWATNISNYDDAVINIRTEEPLENLLSDVVKEGHAFITVQH